MNNNALIIGVLGGLGLLWLVSRSKSQAVSPSVPVNTNVVPASGTLQNGVYQLGTAGPIIVGQQTQPGLSTDSVAAINRWNQWTLYKDIYTTVLKPSTQLDDLRSKVASTDPLKRTTTALQNSVLS